MDINGFFLINTVKMQFHFHLICSPVVYFDVVFFLIVATARKSVVNEVFEEIVRKVF